MRRASSNTADLPPPSGPYSPSVRIGNMVACAGQVGRKATGEVVSGVGPQTIVALENIGRSLAALGATMTDILCVRVYLTDPNQFSEMNAAYMQFFDDPYPARTTVYVGLPVGLLVEIDALAVLAD